MSEDVRRCLGCQATYPPDEHACPSCGSHAADVEQVEAKTPANRSHGSDKPKPKRKT